MKKFVVSLLFIFTLVSCSNEKVVQPETPFDAARLMEHHIDMDNYSRFQSLFYKGAENSVSLDTFNKLGEISGPETNYKTYQLITLNNGEMLLVEFAPKPDDETNYKIVDVKVVPDKMKSLFEE